MDDAHRVGGIPLKLPDWVAGAAVAGLVGEGRIQEVRVIRSTRPTRKRSKLGLWMATDRSRLAEWLAAHDRRAVMLPAQLVLF